MGECHGPSHTPSRESAHSSEESPDKQDKFRRYRARKKARGLRERRMWVPDVNAPGFQKRLDDQIAAINASKDEAEVLEWTEAMATETWNQN